MCELFGSQDFCLLSTSGLWHARAAVGSRHAFGCTAAELSTADRGQRRLSDVFPATALGMMLNHRL